MDERKRSFLLVHMFGGSWVNTQVDRRFKEEVNEDVFKSE